MSFCSTSPPTISTFRRSRFWRKVFWNIVARSCWSPTTATCSIEFQMLFLVSMGGAGRFADYSQWEIWQAAQVEAAKRQTSSGPAPKEQSVPSPPKKKLSYLEGREYATIEQRVAEAEANLAAKQAAMEDPAIVSDHERILAAHAEYDEARRVVDELYARWAELESKLS